MDEQPDSVRKSKPRQAGFTLIELIMVIVIIGIMIAVALPSMGQMIANTKIKGAANELFFDLSYARSEAIKRNEKVRVRRDASWTDGWKVVLVKPDDTDGVTLKTQSATKAISASEWIDGVAGTIDKIDFNSAGRTAAPAGSLRLDFSSSASLTTMRCVSLTASGRPAVRIDKNRDGDCND